MPFLPLFACLLLLMPAAALRGVEKEPRNRESAPLPWLGEGWPMRMRVCADYTAGVACRLPYLLLPRDQAVATYSRLRPVAMPGPADDPRGGGQATMLQWENQASVRLVSEPATNPPADLAAAGDRLVGATLTWQPYDYYAASPARPFAAKDWAPAGVTALRGSAPGIEALAIGCARGSSAVILSGDLAKRIDLLDQVQVMAADRAGRLRTWGEAQGEKGIAFGSDGRPAPAPAKASRTVIPWAKGFDLETRHYHVSGHSSPARLAAHAADLEALYAAYSAFFGTTEGSPLKFEVHITNTWDDFARLSAACGSPLENKPGQVLGGFFIPLSQALWVYEDSGKLGGPSMSIEHVMSHECSHQFLHMACNGSDHVPTWINEGIAVHFENGVLAKGRYQHRPPVDRIRRLSGLYRERKSTLQPMNAYLDHHGSIDADLYGEVYAMVHFWAFGAPGGRERFLAYWKALRAGEDGLQAFERIFIADMATAAGSREKALENWRMQLTEYVVRQLTKLK